MPLHPRADLLKEQHVTHTYYLDYFLAIGKSVGMDLIATESDVEGESACHAPSTLHSSYKRRARIIIYFPPQSFLSICTKNKEFNVTSLIALLCNGQMARYECLLRVLAHPSDDPSGQSSACSSHCFRVRGFFALYSKRALLHSIAGGGSYLLQRLRRMVYGRLRVGLLPHLS